MLNPERIARMCAEIGNAISKFANVLPEIDELYASLCEKGTEMADEAYIKESGVRLRILGVLGEAESLTNREASAFINECTAAILKCRGESIPDVSPGKLPFEELHWSRNSDESF